MMFTKSAILFLLAMASTALVDASGKKQWRIRFRNIAFNQPFSRILLSVHNDKAAPLFVTGEASTEAFAIMAEDGNPVPLEAEVLAGDTGIKEVQLADGPLFAGEGSYIDFFVDFDKKFRSFSFATMAINTNDCFVGGNSLKLRNGRRFTVPGYDAGSEENNEDCASIPGPACLNEDGSNPNESSGNGEGFIHIHRGIHGMFEGEATDLTPQAYDWRNPMASVEVTLVRT